MRYGFQRFRKRRLLPRFMLVKWFLFLALAILALILLSFKR